jgi:hypothetical protein
MQAEVQVLPDDLTLYEVSGDRKKIGSRLYRFAWVIEFFAVGIGLGIAVMQLATSFTELAKGKEGALGFGDYTNIVIAAVPFLMVAIVELTKIPFVDAFYQTSHRVWKAVFLVSLVIISGITFESALNGFERNFNALNIGVDRLQKRLLVVEESMVPIQERIGRAEELTLEGVEENYSTRFAELTEQKDSQTRTFEDRKREVRASIQSQYTEGLITQSDASRDELAALREQLRSDLANHTERFNEETDSLSTTQNTKLRQLSIDYEREQGRLDTMRQQAEQTIGAASIFSRGSVRERVDAEISAQESKVELARQRFEKAQSSQVNSERTNQYRVEQRQIRVDFEGRILRVQSQIDSLNDRYNQSIGTRERDVASTIEGYDEEIASIEEKFSGQFEEVKETRLQQLEILNNNTNLIAGWEGELDDLRDQRVSLRDDINTAVSENQIYRMAQLFSGADSAADIPKEYVVNVAVIWFSSLAAMVAFTGVLLAMAANVIRDPKLPDHANRKSNFSKELGKTARSARRWVAHRRRLDRKPIIKERVREVIKEVPVDRVVRQDVPVETIKKELIHVPLYTNDPKLLKTGFSRIEEADNKKDTITADEEFS